MARSNRPTLPPLHTLGLPRGDIPPRVHEPNRPVYALSSELWLPDAYPPRQPHFPLTQPNCQQQHQPPIPPSTASEKPTPPAPCLTNTPASALTSTSTAPFPARKIRLSPTSLENADAVVVVSPPPAPNEPPPQALLLVGPALQRLRNRQRQLAQGARVHPYRIVRGPSPTEQSHPKA